MIIGERRCKSPVRNGSMISFRAKMWSSVVSMTSLSSWIICRIADLSAGIDCPIWNARAGKKLCGVTFLSEQNTAAARAPLLVHWSAMSCAMEDFFLYCRVGYLNQQVWRPALLSSQSEICESKPPGARITESCIGRRSGSLASWTENLRSSSHANQNCKLASFYTIRLNSTNTNLQWASLTSHIHVDRENVLLF